jgi:phytoene synthase
MTPRQYAERKAVPRGSSLYYSVYFAPRDRQPALRALYAYQREVTEIVREVREHSVAAAKLQWWRMELDRVFDGHPQHPVGQALQQDVLADHAVAREPFAQVIEGVELDLAHGLYPSFRELGDYCHRVGGSITRLAVDICGYRNPATTRYAHDLGMALQLFTLLRRVRRDLDAGRLYLPEADMREVGVSQTDLLQRRTTDPVRRLFALQAARIRDFFTHALEQLPTEDRWPQRDGIVLARLYQALLDEMEAAGFPLLERSIHLTPIRKFWLAWRTARRQHRYRKATS